MIYLRLSKEDDARLTRAAERSGKSKVALAREAIEVKLPMIERQAAEFGGRIQFESENQN